MRGKRRVFGWFYSSGGSQGACFVRKSRSSSSGGGEMTRERFISARFLPKTAFLRGAIARAAS